LTRTPALEADIRAGAPALNALRTTLDPATLSRFFDAPESGASELTDG
jgi:hypothetical protein